MRAATVVQVLQDGLVLSFVACFILPVIAPLNGSLRHLVSECSKAQWPKARQRSAKLARTEENVTAVDEPAVSQEDQPQIHRLARQSSCFEASVFKNWPIIHRAMQRGVLESLIITAVRCYCSVFQWRSVDIWQKLVTLISCDHPVCVSP